MRTFCKFLLLLCGFTGVALSQSAPQIQYTANTPSGACNATRIQLLTPNGTLYTCQSGTWGAVGGGGGGSCTTLGGDVTGTCAANTVVKLQNRALASTAPSDGQAIVWDSVGTTWKPGTAGALPAGSLCAGELYATSTTFSGDANKFCYVLTALA